MRLDGSNLSFLTKADWRVLHILETESKLQHVVSIDVIAKKARLDKSLIDQICQSLSRYKLIKRVCSGDKELESYPTKRKGHKGVPLGTAGYILSFGGIDYLALNFFINTNKSILAVSNSRLGVGKEADIHVCSIRKTMHNNFSSSKDDSALDRGDNPGRTCDKQDTHTYDNNDTDDDTDDEGVMHDQQTAVLKLHRLGRTSFRSVRLNRDYHLWRPSGSTTSSWIHLSERAALKEWTTLQRLYDLGFPVPKPISYSRHAIVMEKIDGLPLNQIGSLNDPQKLYLSLLTLIVRLAEIGIVHGDFNEFNILVKEMDESPVVIDFPQTISTRHQNAEEYFYFLSGFRIYERDIACINKWFFRNFPEIFTEMPGINDDLDDPDGGSATSKSEQEEEEVEIDEQVVSDSEDSQQVCDWSSSDDIEPPPHGGVDQQAVSFANEKYYRSFKHNFTVGVRKFPPRFSDIVPSRDISTEIRASGFTHSVQYVSDANGGSGFLEIY